MATSCCRERAVLVAVYAERPGIRRRLPPLKEGRQNRHHHISSRNKRAELLEYSRHLRASAKPPAASPPVLSFQPTTTQNKLPPTLQIVPSNRKPKLASSPTCFCKWEFLMPSFLRSMMTTKDKGKKKDKNTGSTTTKIKVLVKSLQVPKKVSFITKLFTKLRTHR